MNYLDNLNRRAERREQMKRQFRKKAVVILIFGLVVGFLIGRYSAHDAKAEMEAPVSDPGPVATSAIYMEIPVEFTPTPEPELEYLGTYRITAYCSCEKCCGEWAKNRPNGIVYGAAGIELKAGLSCASPLPLGTAVEIEGLGTYVVQDRMAQWVIEKYGDGLIDIYFDNHEEACKFGLKYLDVYKKGELS